MASPTSNAVGSTTFNPALSGIGRYVTFGEKWGGGFGGGVTLPYSFPGGPYGTPSAYFAVGYGQNEWNSWYAFTPVERNAAIAALKVWDGVSNISFYETYDNQTYVGELRFARADMADFAHAYYPGGTPQAGNSWYRNGGWHTSSNTAISAGSYDFVTLLHEIGHALGLKHPFSTPNVMPVALDNYFYSIMSYTASPWSAREDNYATFYPTTPMYYDLVAIQAIYGRDTGHNKGNTTYSFSSAGTYFMTIDDAGGTDKIVYSGSVGCSINLNPAAFNSLGKAITFRSESSRDTVCIGPGTIIENAYGSSGNDKIIGNHVGNKLYGSGGNDSMRGGNGFDFLSGGGGNDILYGDGDPDVLVGGAGRDKLIGGKSADVFDFNTPGESVRGSLHDTIADFRRKDGDKIDLRSIDADTSNNPGNDVFKFIASQGFHGGGGEVRYAKGLIQADINGDRVADFEIKINVAVVKGDFLL